MVPSQSNDSGDQGQHQHVKVSLNSASNATVTQDYMPRPQNDCTGDEGQHQHEKGSLDSASNAVVTEDYMPKCQSAHRHVQGGVSLGEQAGDLVRSETHLTPRILNIHPSTHK